MSYTVQYRVVSITHPDKVYTDKLDFWDDHSKTTSVDTTAVSNGKVQSFDGVLDVGGKSVTKAIVFVDEAAFNAYIIEIANLFSSLGITDDELNYTRL